MIVIFRDEVGGNAIYVNKYGVSFCDGYAYFSSDTRNYKVPVGYIQEIR